MLCSGRPAAGSLATVPFSAYLECLVLLRAAAAFSCRHSALVIHKDGLQQANTATNMMSCNCEGKDTKLLLPRWSISCTHVGAKMLGCHSCCSIYPCIDTNASSSPILVIHCMLHSCCVGKAQLLAARCSPAVKLLAVLP
jgi:hypothetical protein